MGSSFKSWFMGVRSSSSAPPPSPFFSEPWRTISWADKSDLQYLKDYKPQTDGQQLRILLHGPVGAGKSSFINSVQSLLRGRMSRQALVDNTSGSCFTKKYTTYKIQKDQQIFYPFVFNDIMGLAKDKGVPVDDVKLALKGHVKEGYEFNPESSLSEDNPFYNKHPTANDKVHVLVCVVPATTISQMRQETVQKIRNIRMEASKLDIPQVAILTKIDEACPEVKKHLRNVYRAKYIKNKMEEFSVNVGIPMNCIFPVKNHPSIHHQPLIPRTGSWGGWSQSQHTSGERPGTPWTGRQSIFPVKNYHEEINLNSDIDSLILSALTNIINFGDDCINLGKDSDSKEELLNFSIKPAPPYEKLQ